MRSRMRIALAGTLLLLGGCIPPAVEAGGYGPPPREQDRSRQRPISRQVPPRIDADIEGLPETRPAWEARPVRPEARRIDASTYTVRDGDSLRLIAVRTGAGSEVIARANGLQRPYTIRPGQRLIIPAGRYHLVREGETGIAIARAYGVDWGRLVTVNDLSEPYILRGGMRLLIPDSGPESIEERAARFHIDIDDLVTGSQPALSDTGRPAVPTAAPRRELPSTAAVAAPSHLAGGFVWPARGTIVKRFGPGASGERYDGIKIAVPLDTPVRAAADGVVAYVGADVPSLGGLVILRHGDGWTTVYGHAGQLLVKRGQSVKRGQEIALAGEAGSTGRPAVHFEIRQGRTPVDPVPRLPSR